MELVLSGLQLYFAKARVFTYEFWYFNEKIQGDNLSILAHYLAKKWFILILTRRTRGQKRENNMLRRFFTIAFLRLNKERLEGDW